MYNLMLDLETLGTESNAAILSIGASLFDMNSGRIADTFYQVIDLQSSIDHGKVEAETLKWWLKQNKGAQKIFFDNDAVILKDALFALSLFVKNNSDENLQVWSNGASFDISILNFAYSRHKLKAPWNFRNERDVRTIVYLAKEISKVDVTKSLDFLGERHNALDDAIYQSKYVSLAFNLLHGNKDGN